MKIGYASTLGVALMVVIGIFTLIYFRVLSRRGLLQLIGKGCYMVSALKKSRAGVKPLKVLKTVLRWGV